MQSAAMLSILSLQNEYIFHFDIPTKSPALETIRQPSNLLAKRAIDAQTHSQLSKQIKAAAEMLRHLYPGGHQTAQSSPWEDTGTLRRLGYQLFDLLPFSIQQALVNLPLSMPLILRSDDFSLPWELLHDGEQWLTLKRPVGWCLLSETLAKSDVQRGQRTDGSDEFLVISNPTGDLPEADLEAEWLFDAAELGFMYPRLLHGSGASRVQVLNALASGDYPIIHYSGHAKAGALILADGELTAQEIQKELRGQPFIFLNACSSAAEEQSQPSQEVSNISQTVQGLAQAFILGGASGVVGTLWPVFDVTSRQFAQTFYPLVLKSRFSIGEALLQARQEMYEARPNDPLWASFMLVGDPTLKLVNSLPPETRSMTLLVAHLEGLSSLFKQFSLEEAVEIQEDVITLLREVSERHDAQFHGSMRHTLNLYFGIPKAHGDDAALAIHAALEMLEKLNEFNQQEGEYLTGPLSLRIGISTGRVLAQSITASAADYQIAGPVTNIAAALANQAERGQIIVDKTTRQSTRKKFKFQTLEPLAVDNDNEVPYRVIGATSRTFVTTFVGREEELSDLHRQWRSAKSRRGRIIGLVGDPGIGKTRLVQTFREQMVDAHQWISATSYSYSKNQSDALLAQVIRGLATIGPREEEISQRKKLEELVYSSIRDSGSRSRMQPARALALLGDVVGLSFPAQNADLNLEAEQKRTLLARTIENVLKSKAQSQPIVLVLEDLQWADEASLLTLTRIAKSVKRMPVLLLAVHRPESSHDWRNWSHYRNMPLEELEADAQRTLLSNLLPVLPKELEQVVLDQTGGNPLFIEEYIKLLEDYDYLDQDGNVLGTDFSQIPHKGSLESVIQARLDRLESQNCDLLQRAAVIGQKFDNQVLAKIQPKSASPSAEEHIIEELIDRNLIKPLDEDETIEELKEQKLIDSEEEWEEEKWLDLFFYAFRHGLVHEMVYSLLSEPLRQAIHRLVAEVLQTLYDETKIVERLAHHYYYSRDRVKAIRYCLGAAKHAASEWANQTALTWYERTEEKIVSFEEQPASETEQADGATPSQLIEWHVEALEGCAEVKSVIGKANEAMAVYKEALRLAADMPITRRADLYRKLAIVHHNKGQFDLARETLSQGLEILDGLNCLEAGRIHVYMGMIDYRQRQIPVAFTSCQQGIAIIKETENIRDLAQAYNLQGILYRNLGKKQEAILAYDESIALYKQAEYLPGQEKATYNLGCVYQDLGQWNKAQALFEDSSSFSDTMGNERRQAAALNNLGEIYRRQGQISKAIERYASARQILEELGFEEFVGAALINLGASYLKTGALSEASTYLSEALTLFQRLEANLHLPELLRYQAELEVLKGQADKALKLAQEAVEWSVTLSRRVEEGPARRTLGQAYRELGQLSEAAIELDKSLTILEEDNNPYEVGLTLLQLALLGQAQANANQDNTLWHKSQAYCDRAIEIFNELGAALDLEQAQKIRHSLHEVNDQPCLRK